MGETTIDQKILWDAGAEERVDSSLIALADEADNSLARLRAIMAAPVFGAAEKTQRPQNDWSADSVNARLNTAISSLWEHLAQREDRDGIKYLETIMSTLAGGGKLNEGDEEDEGEKAVGHPFGDFLGPEMQREIKAAKDRVRGSSFPTDERHPLA